MFINSKGIVLHKNKYADSSLIVKIYTETHGTLTFLIKNAFAKKSKFNASLFGSLNVLDLTFNYTPQREILFLKEASLHQPFNEIPFDLNKSSILIFYNELLYKYLIHADADTELFHLIENNLYELDTTTENIADFHIKFLIKLINQQGITPENNYSTSHRYLSLYKERFEQTYHPDDTLSEASSLYISNLFNKETPQKINKETRLETLRGLVSYLQIHYEHIGTINSISILSNIIKK